MAVHNPLPQSNSPFNVLVGKKKNTLENSSVIQEFQKARVVEDVYQQNPDIMKLYTEYKKGKKIEELPQQIVVRTPDREVTVTSEEYLEFFNGVSSEQDELKVSKNKAAKLIKHFLEARLPGLKDFLESAKQQSRKHNDAHHNLMYEKILDGFCMTTTTNTITGKSGGIERILVDRKHDRALQEVIDKFKKSIASDTDEKIKIKKLLELVRSTFEKTEIADTKAAYEALRDWTEQVGKKTITLPLGNTITAGAGMCRHRALLTKILADEVGLTASLESGKFNGGGHAWNEFQLTDGKIVVFDASRPSKQIMYPSETYGSGGGGYLKYSLLFED